MGELVGDRRRETEKEREKDTERGGGGKQMFQNCVPTMTMNTQWISKNICDNIDIMLPRNEDSNDDIAHCDTQKGDQEEYDTKVLNIIVCSCEMPRNKNKNAHKNN